MAPLTTSDFAEVASNHPVLQSTLPFEGRGPDSVRFSPGEIVNYKNENDDWVEGRILQVCRKHRFIDQFIPYVIQEAGTAEVATVMIHTDSSDFVRPRENKFPDAKSLNPMDIEPFDPRASMYVTGPPELEKLAKRFCILNKRYKNPDGPTRLEILNINGLLRLKAGRPVVYGLDDVSIYCYGKFILARNPPFKITKTAMMRRMNIPPKATLRELEAAARTSSEKMLQLGDVLLFGIHGIPRDSSRAFTCYCAAALNSQEEGFNGRNSLAYGNPQAMVTAAYMNLRIAHGISLTEVDVHEPSYEGRPLRRCLEVLLKYGNGPGDPCGLAITKIFEYIQESLRKGLLSLCALEVIRSINESSYTERRLVEFGLQNEVKQLSDAQRYYNLQLDYMDLQARCALPVGDPSSATLELFRPKAMEIYKDLPVVDENIHICLMPIPKPPYTTVVFLTVPSRKQLLKVIRLPPSLEVMPYCRESIEFIWHNIVFLLHTGIPTRYQRFRPSSFSLSSVEGDLPLGRYLSSILDEVTPVQVIEPTESVQVNLKPLPPCSVKLTEIITEITSLYLMAPKSFTGIPESKDFIDLLNTATARASNRLMSPSRTSIDEQELYHFALSFKNEGNEEYKATNFEKALQLYLAGILCMKFPHEGDEGTGEWFKLLGVFHSNCCQCALALEARQGEEHTDFRLSLTKLAVEKCDAILNNVRIRLALPSDISKKVRYRRDKALSRLDALKHGLPRNPVVEVDEDVPSATQFEVARSSSIQSDAIADGRKRKKKKKNRRRNRSRQDSDDLEHKEDDASVGQDEDDEDRKPAASSPFDSCSSDCDEYIVTDQDEYIMNGRTIHETKIAANWDTHCPICHNEFSGELSRTYCTIFPDPCAIHAVCLPCACRTKKVADKDRREPSCSLCQATIDRNFFERLAENIIDADPELRKLIQTPPFNQLEDRRQIVEALLWKNDFEVPKVVEFIENMILADIKVVYYRTEMADLTYQQKDKIYHAARAPVERLIWQRKQLEEERRTTFDPVRNTEISEELYKLRGELAAARRKAHEEIYSKINNVGSMGVEFAGSKCVVIDFHGLQAAEAEVSFKEVIKPILPVVKQIMVVTGRGLHSTGGVAKLKNWLKKHIGRNEPDIRYELVPNNDGALMIHWEPQGS